MKTICLAFLITFFAAIPSIAQVEKEADHVQRAISRLFEGMQRGDSAMVRSAFMPEITSATITDDKKSGGSIVRESTIHDFLVAVGTPHQNVWNEETWNMTIKVDGNFAQAWCDYAFFIGHTFSHCGVDAFHLFKSKGEWKIFHIADTRRKEPCTIPDKIKAKHKE